MPRKNKDENEEAVTTPETVDATSEDAVDAAPSEETTAVEAAADEAGAPTEEAAPEAEAAPAEEAASVVDAAPAEETVAADGSSAGDATADTPAAKERKAPVRAAKKVKPAVEPVTETKKASGKRAEKVGIIASDKMMKTVTVRVDRLVKHPIYRKYVKRRKKFMAHDDLGARIGDKVRIVETRPMSARKRWRVVEILHRAES
jgi:small subunit ribosomal protein S17